MVKITTKQQFQHLIQEMKNNLTIARGVRSFGETKASNAETWKKISDKLNKFGPPIRTPEEWQRVWIHFKAKLKRKISTNLYTTGGEPSQEVSLSTIEQTAADILQLEPRVSPAVNLFDTNFIENVKVENEEYQLTELQDYCELPQEPEQQPFNQQQSELKKVQQAPRKRKNIEDISFSPLHEQTHTEGVDTLKNIDETLNKTYEVLKDIRDIKKKKLDLLIEDLSLNQKIKQKKLEILERQLNNLSN